MILKNKYLFLILLLSGTLLVIHSCKKEEAPANPYSNINYGSTTNNDTIDPNSFTGLHKTIFSTKCAMPGCHDGNFEPDFRTVQSAYATLVYHPVVKKLSPWQYRVVPHDTANSWLWQRLNHSLIISGADTSQGRMPLYSTPLSTNDLNRISTWILNGAKDMFGTLPVYPNSEPVIAGYIAVNNSYAQIDTNRTGDVFYNPFKVPAAYSFKVVVGPTDDSTAVANLQNNKLKLSTDENNFSGAVTYNGTYVASGIYKLWVFDVTSTGFYAGDTIYMRYYTNDGDHVNDTEFPRNDLVFQYKTWWAFIVQ